MVAGSNPVAPTKKSVVCSTGFFVLCGVVRICGKSGGNYLLMEKIWNGHGTRYFLFEFPVEVFLENNKGKRGNNWLNISVE